MNKGGSPVFHQDSKTIVADHQQLKSAICAVAISSTHSCQIVHQSSLVPQVQPPSCQGSIRHLLPLQLQSGLAGSLPSASQNDSAPAMERCQWCGMAELTPSGLDSLLGGRINTRRIPACTKFPTSQEPLETGVGSTARKRFLQQEHIGLEHAVVRQHVIRVARNVEYLQSGPHGLEA